MLLILFLLVAPVLVCVTAARTIEIEVGNGVFAISPETVTAAVGDDILDIIGYEGSLYTALCVEIQFY